MSPGSSYRSEDFDYDDDFGLDYQSGSRAKKPHAAPRPANMPTRKNNTTRSLRKRQRNSASKPTGCRTGIQRRRDKHWSW